MTSLLRYRGQRTGQVPTVVILWLDWPDQEALFALKGELTPPALKENNGGPLDCLKKPRSFRLRFCYQPTLWPDVGLSGCLELIIVSRKNR